MLPATDSTEIAALRQQTLKELASQQRMQSWLKVGIGLAVGLGGMAAGLFVLLAPNMSDISDTSDISGWLLAIAGVLLLIVYQAGMRMVNRLVDRYRRASEQVRHGIPEAVRLGRTWLVAFEGRLFRDDEARRMFAFQIAKYSQFGVQQAGPAWIWRHPVSQEVVGNDGGHVAIGVCLDRQGFGRTMRGIAGIWRLLTGATLLLIGIFVGHTQWIALPQAQGDRDRAVAAQAWPRVTARVTLSQVKEIRISRGKTTVSAWIPDIRYHYAVQGREWQGATRRVYEAPLERPEKVAPILARYPVGAAIEVAVSPADPALAVIEPGHEQALERQISDLQQVSVVLLLVGGLICALFMALARWQKRLGEQVQAAVFGETFH